jgi:hypothetical protein
MDKKAMMIRTTDGCYWLDTTDGAGRRRSSYLGNIGSAVVVEAWCQVREIEFRQVGRPSASTARTRGQPESGRNPGSLVARHPACPA